MNLLKTLFKKRDLKSIDKEVVEKEISNFKELGIATQKRNPRLIISLTSFPQRMYEIHFTLYSLLTQSIKPDEVVLWLGEEQFPNKEGDIPEKVLKLKENGLKIKWSKNLFSFTKLVPSLLEYPEDIIVTADDDIFYEKEWLEKLYKEYQNEPQYITCHRAHKVILDKNKKIAPYKRWPKKIKSSIAFTNFLTGVGGVLYPPHCLHEDATNIPLFTKLAKRQDDIWFWAMALLKGTKIKVIKNNISRLTYINPARERGLTDEITLFKFNRSENDIGMGLVTSHFPEITEILQKK